jgi:SRSO17 transposase
VGLPRSRPVVTHNQDATAAAATVADEDGRLFRELLGKVAGCFPRRETRRNAADMVGGLLMELEDHNCWFDRRGGPRAAVRTGCSICCPGRSGDQQVLERAADWAVERLDDGDAVLVVDETADAKSSGDAAGAARQYSGTLGGIALCQAAVTLTYASGRGHALIDRALYLPEACAADKEHRELVGIPDEVIFATKPQLAASLLDRACERGVRAAFVTGDEVYGGRELRRSVRTRDMGYVLAVRSNTTLAVGTGLVVTAAEAAGLILDRGWQRLRTGSGTKGVRHYDWAM